MMRFVYLIRLQLVLNKQKVPGARHLVLWLKSRMLSNDFSCRVCRNMIYSTNVLKIKAMQDTLERGVA